MKHANPRSSLVHQGAAVRSLIRAWAFTSSFLVVAGLALGWSNNWQ